jgi:hypothetical protein
MGANSGIRDAFNKLETKKEMPAADFQLLKRAIETFQVRIIVHDNTNLKRLNEMCSKCAEDLEQIALTIKYNTASTNVYYNDLKYWKEILSAEIRRITLKKPGEPVGVPSQHVQIAPAYCKTLRNILSPETLRRPFISLEKLTKAIRTELLAFLTDDCRHLDRIAVVEQIKQCHRR